MKVELKERLDECVEISCDDLTAQEECVSSELICDWNSDYMQCDAMSCGDLTSPEECRVSELVCEWKSDDMQCAGMSVALRRLEAFGRPY